jgi:hypothetical protein
MTTDAYFDDAVRTGRGAGELALGPTWGERFSMT